MYIVDKSIIALVKSKRKGKLVVYLVRGQRKYTKLWNGGDAEMARFIVPDPVVVLVTDGPLRVFLECGRFAGEVNELFFWVHSFTDILVIEVYNVIKRVH